MDGTNELDRRSGESDEQYNQRIDKAAEDAGQSRVEYERAASERATRPAVTHPDDAGQRATGIA